jgi:hypothetical protein
MPQSLDAELAELLRTTESSSYEPPTVLTAGSRNEDQAEWVLAGVIIAAAAVIVGVSVAWATYVCSVCQARSLNACVNDLRRWWGAGC